MQNTYRGPFIAGTARQWGDGSKATSLPADARTFKETKPCRWQSQGDVGRKDRVKTIDGTQMYGL